MVPSGNPSERRRAECRLITWNVAGRVTRHAEQAEALAGAAPDVVALQEVTAKTAPWWREALAAAGLTACAVTRAQPPRRLGVLTVCGDLNTPRREQPDGEILTFAHDSKGRLREERGERWNAAERALVRDLGWTDAYRSLHGYGERSASWTYARDRGGYRLDHVLLHGLRPRSAEYLHDWRRAGLSDHSALVVELGWDVRPLAGAGELRQYGGRVRLAARE